MAFGVATVVTNLGKAMFADRVRGTPGTYTNPPKYAGMGTGATGAARTAAVGDTALSTNDSYQNISVITASASRSVDEFGLFDASSSGNMFFSATLTIISMVNGDSVQFTAKVQLT